MEFTWIISQMDSKIKETIEGQELQNVVNVVHWRYKATLDEYEAEVYGALDLDGANPNDFILYENLTESDGGTCVLILMYVQNQVFGGTSSRNTP